MGTAASAGDALRSARPDTNDEGAPSRDHLRVAPDSVRQRRRNRLLMAGIVLLTIVSLFALVGFRVIAAQSAFTLDRLSKERTNEQLRYERLREEVARRSSPDAVISAALQRGMVFADRKEFIQAPAAAPTHTTPNATPRPLAPTSYDQAKQALDQNP